MPSISERLAAAKAAMSDPGTMIGTFNQIADNINKIAQMMEGLPSLIGELRTLSPSTRQAAEQSAKVTITPGQWNQDQPVNNTALVQGVVAYVPGVPLTTAVSLVIDGQTTPQFTVGLVMPWQNAQYVKLSAQPSSTVVVEFTTSNPGSISQG